MSRPNYRVFRVTPLGTHPEVGIPAVWSPSGDKIAVLAGGSPNEDPQLRTGNIHAYCATTRELVSKTSTYVAFDRVRGYYWAPNNDIVILHKHRLISPVRWENCWDSTGVIRWGCGAVYGIGFDSVEHDMRENVIYFTGKVDHIKVAGNADWASGKQVTGTVGWVDGKLSVTIADASDVSSRQLLPAPKSFLPAPKKVSSKVRFSLPDGAQVCISLKNGVVEKSSPPDITISAPSGAVGPRGRIAIVTSGPDAALWIAIHGQWTPKIHYMFGKQARNVIARILVANSRSPSKLPDHLIDGIVKAVSNKW